MSTVDFYDRLAPFFHLIYPDWEASIQRQGEWLDRLIRSHGGSCPGTVLDAACGVGTQSLGLARLGYEVTASDLSPGAVARAAREAQARGLSLRTSVADMRRAFDHHGRSFDVVIACDNSVPHLLSDADILAALDQFFHCTATGGLCLVSLRDYATMPRGQTQLHPHGLRLVDGTRYVLFQVWDWAGDCYETTMYVVEHPATGQPMVHAMCATYYAIAIKTVIALMQQVGFQEVLRLDDAFFQPILVGRKQ